VNEGRQASLSSKRIDGNACRLECALYRGIHVDVGITAQPSQEGDAQFVLRESNIIA
jgi:hypothetical protein